MEGGSELMATARRIPVKDIYTSRSIASGAGCCLAAGLSCVDCLLEDQRQAEVGMLLTRIRYMISTHTHAHTLSLSLSLSRARARALSLSHTRIQTHTPQLP